MNSAGQASNVFNLLISAVVAIAILGILFSLLTPILIQKKFEDEAPKVLKSAAQNRATLQNTMGLTIQPKAQITSRQMANAQVGLNSDQICVSAGSFGEEFEASGGTILTYMGSNAKKIGVGAFCEINDPNNGIGEAIDELDTGDGSRIQSSFIDDCDWTDVQEDDVVCVVFPMTNRE